MDTRPVSTVRRCGFMRSLGVLLGGAFILAAATAGPVLPTAEYAIFSALLRHGLDPTATQAVIADTTTGDPARVVTGEITTARANALGTTVALLSEWSRLNQRTFTLARDFDLPVPYTFLREGDRDLLFRGDEPVAGWKLFFERYPGSSGLIRLSRAAYDTASRQALVYLEFQCGPECGSGRLIQLSQTQDGHWQVDGGELIWITGPSA